MSTSTHLNMYHSCNSFMTKVLSYRNQSINLQSKPIDWFLYDRELPHERVKQWHSSQHLRYFHVLKNMYAKWGLEAFYFDR